MATPAKLVKFSAESTENELIFYAPQKLFGRQIEGMKRAMTSLGYHTTSAYGENITHIVSGFTYVEDVWDTLGRRPSQQVNVISPKWHADCIRAKQLLPVETYTLQSKPEKDKEISKEEVNKEEKPYIYSCQRRTPLEHHNKVLTEALETLSLAANFNGGDTNYSRSLAFRRCASVLKSLPFRVQNISQIRNESDVGKHCLTVIKDILETGSSPEVDSYRDSVWFNTVKLFSDIFGVGSVTAKEWYFRGLRTLDDVKTDPIIIASVDPRLNIGISCYEDLLTPVSLREAEAWQSFIYRELKTGSPDVQVDITGGFRRGKTFGHDIDLLISVPQVERERGLLPELIDKLISKGLVLYGRYEKSTFTEDRLKDDTKHTPLRNTLDHFEKWIGVVKMNDALANSTSTEKRASLSDIGTFIPKSLRTATTEIDSFAGLSVKEGCLLASCDRDWVARRVDLIVTPISQYYFALVGWTGSKEFNRSLRWYAQRELNVKLTSHGIWDYKEKRSVEVNSEKEFFEKLKLPYFHPHERNC